MFAIRRKDVFLLIGVLVVALAAFLLTPLLRPAPGAEVLITLDGREYARVHLGSRQAVLIDCGDGESNVLLVEEDGMYMESATCRDQLCVQQGRVSTENYLERALGGDIICLPHRLVCSLLPADDAARDAPDR